MQLVQIAGFLGADPKERTTATGKRVVKLRVAVHTFKHNKDETVWWSVSLWGDRWGDRFDKIINYLKKGSPVIAIGDMGKPETYTTDDGCLRIELSLTANIIRPSFIQTSVIQTSA